jgi:hypothetical protein
LARSYVNFELSRVFERACISPVLLAGFYSDGTPAAGNGLGAGAQDASQEIKYNHLSQKRLFSAALRTATRQTRDCKLAITARARQTAWNNLPLVS